MDQAYFIDKLKRASQMEEEMNGLLTELAPGLIPGDLKPETCQRITEILKEIHADTRRHQALAQAMIARLSAGGARG